MLVVPALFSDSMAPAVTAAELEKVLFGAAKGPTTLARYYEYVLVRSHHRRWQRRAVAADRRPPRPSRG